MNRKLVLLGILLLVGLTFAGCVAVGGYGHGYGDDYGYYGYPHGYGYYNYGNRHGDWDGYRGSWGGSRHWR